MTDPAALLLRGSVRASVSSCTRCPLHQRCQAPVPFRGAMAGIGKGARLVVIGEAPGPQEDKAGKPFVGPSGKLMDFWLKSRVCDEFNLLEYDEIAFVNSVSCFPKRTPGTTEIAACRINLHQQLSAIDPTHALLVGGVAVSSFWKNVRIGDVRGRWWGLPIMPPEMFGEGTQTYDPLSNSRSKWIPAIATWHPAAVLRGNGADDVLSDLGQLRMALYKGAYGAYETPLCFMCEKNEDSKTEHWLACNLDLGEDVTNRKGAPLSLNICHKHWLQRFGKLERAKGTRKKKGKDDGKVGMF